jgi:hypothetical protein
LDRTSSQQELSKRTTPDLSAATDRRQPRRHSRRCPYRNGGTFGHLGHLRRSWDAPGVRRASRTTEIEPRYADRPPRRGGPTGGENFDVKHDGPHIGDQSTRFGSQRWRWSAQPSLFYRSCDIPSQNCHLSTYAGRLKGGEGRNFFGGRPLRPRSYSRVSFVDFEENALVARNTRR